MIAMIAKNKTVAGEFIEKEGATLSMDTQGRFIASKFVETVDKKGASFRKNGLVFESQLLVERG